MIRIELDEPTLARTRIAISPLWEVLTSLFVVQRHPEEAPWPDTAWAWHARRVLAEVPATAPAKLLTVGLPAPDFLSPIPTSAAPILAEQPARAASRATPASEGSGSPRRQPDG
ncbi:hypothetical protein AB0A95_29030 [Micromonospora sp. NPDC049230]|uniref:hypothetical protein n=1 Tax=Micromonospora sp. NPDC049230 TaxID=3155502 RepID=UPI003402910A